ncbi:MAG TPA: transketolase C-terminal domain-containing protein, partial [Ktedonobacterales bacterium]|nr:transketolase C-terminal domain-containing protein [Ktedonobacterales bacterium]
RAVSGSTVLYPCDANQTAKLVMTMADRPGICYLRTTRAATPVIYYPGDDFPIGGSKVLRRSDSDQVTVVAAGITVFEALKAADQLQKEHLHVRVIDAYSVKPIDTVTLLEAVDTTRGRVVIVEDHWAEGGLGDAVLEAIAGTGFPTLKAVRLAVRTLPGSGKPEQLMNAAGLTAAHIMEAARSLRGLTVA